MSRFSWQVAIAALAMLALGTARLLAAETTTRTADQATLAPLKNLVGQWRGVGQPKRGSNQGAWSEQAQWAWHFADGHASLLATATDGKLYERLELKPAAKSGELELLAWPPSAKEPERFTGAIPAKDAELVLTSPAAAADRPARVSLRQLAEGDRLVILFERAAGTGRYSRLAEVGYTRKGANFALAQSGPECVVTGGHGSIAVQVRGQTYYVCCTGCRDLLLDDPDGVLAEYKARKKAEADKRK